MSAPTFLDVGLHDNVPAAVYHADPCVTPSLSSGVLRTLLGKSIEHAHLEHPRLGGKKRKSSAAMDLGSYVHAVMAGDTSTCEVRDFPTFESKVAKEWVADAEARGMVPTLERTVDASAPIVAALREKAAIGCDNTPFAEHGRSEVTAIWKDGGHERDQVYCRARYDRLVIDPNGYADIWDWKTTTDVSPDALRWEIEDLGYHLQAAFYMRGLATLMPAYAGRISFTFVFVEKAAPYAVQRVCLTEGFSTIAGADVSRAIRQWSHAVNGNNWKRPTEGQTLHLSPSTRLQFQHEERNVA